MMRLALLALLVASCKRGADPKAEVSEETRPGPERGSAGGFSASLSADLELRGPSKGSGSGDFFADSGSGSSGSAAPAPAGASGSASDTAGSAAPSDTKTDTKADTKVVDTKVVDTKVVDTKVVDTKVVDTKVVDTKVVDTKAPDTKAGSASETKPASGSGAGSAKVAAGSAAKPEIEMHVDPPKPPIAMTPELKAIKLSLLPNWKRDAVEPATISLDVDVQSKDVKETFKFHYGYEDPKAPADREAFKKYLADAKIMKVTTDRQRGAAWYLEGSDASGGTSFRLIVTWSGKRLYCGGSSYKSNDLGDIRDEVVVQAKKICETVAL